MSMIKKRTNKSYFDVEKELQFLNEQLDQGYLLTSTSIHAYEFEETSLKGQYYIAYITDEKQKQELDEMADEITEIDNEDFHSVCRIVKRLKNTFYRTDQLKGKWCYYFIPYNFDYCIESDIKRKHEMYGKLLKIKMFYFLLGILVTMMIFVLLIISHSSIDKLLMPWELIESFLNDNSLILAYIMITGLIDLYIAPFVFVFSLYQITRLYNNKRSCL